MKFFKQTYILYFKEASKQILSLDCRFVSYILFQLYCLIKSKILLFNYILKTKPFYIIILSFLFQFQFINVQFSSINEENLTVEIRFTTIYYLSPREKTYTEKEIEIDCSG